MQKSSSQSLASAPASNARLPSRDPRSRGSASSMHPADGIDAVRDHSVDSRGEDTPLTASLKSPNAPSEPDEFENAFFSHVADVIKVDYWTRRLDFLRHQAKGAQQEHEREQKRSNQFPILIEESLQRKNQIDAEYQTAKSEGDASIVTARASAVNFRRILRETFESSKDDQIRTLSKHVASLEQSVRSLRSESEAIASSRPQSDELLRCLQRLEELNSQNETLRKRVESLEQKSALMESCLGGFKGVSASISELRKEIQQIENESKAPQEQALEKIDRVRRSIHLQFENMHSTLKDDCFALRSDLDLLRSQVSTLGEAVETSKASAADERVRVTAVQSELTSLKEENKERSGQVASSLEDLSERLKSTQTKLSQQPTREALDSLQTGLTNIEGLVESLKAVRAQVQADHQNLELTQQDVAELRAIWQDGRNLPAEFDLLRQQFVQDSAMHTARMDKLKNFLAIIQEKFAEKFAEKYGGNLKALRLQLAEQANKQQTENQILKSQVAKYAETFREPKKQHDEHLVGELAQIQHELRKWGSEVQGPRERQAPSDIDRPVEKQDSILLGNCDKLAPLYFGLDQRITTTRETVDVLNTLLSRVQRQLHEVVANQQDIRNQLESLRVTVGNIAADQEKTEGINAGFRSKHEALEKRFEEQLNKAAKDMGDVSTLISQDETDQSTYRELGDKNVKDLHHTIHQGSNRVKHPRHSSSQSDGKAISLEADAPSMNFDRRSQVTPGEADRETIIMANAAQALKNSSTTVNGNSDDNEHSRKELLAKFKKPVTPQSHASSKPQPWSARACGHSQPTSKRKHAESQKWHDPGDDDEDEVQAPRRNTRRYG
ncbi:uncharacterized protein Z519_06812 [Cladophialophora bantiana CBS 173.52]|uniref:Uncharacterized protein n=1 Tax=Cladophialophora bantiana (strain ATCC 10958 / CBS 173.52 / CDC B-1940 / NIH 8579) TaxID=1442370 RepID=A0A0D2HI99_CLAB1|nr:uncharacterized protein Z519_06812 [Cladophialophora bantiana CBS 173.52]KIW92963.1 hypothetical protein Z519_06812 [Cladophialophora bantiana CBS 173.52]